MFFGTAYDKRKPLLPRDEPWFAWRPVILEDGRVAWGETIRRVWWRDPNVCFDCDRSRWQYFPLHPAGEG